MPVLTASELSNMRTLAGGSLPNTCIILSPTNSVDSMGGFSTSWGTVTAGAACKLSATTEKTVNDLGDKLNIITGWTLSVAYDQTIASGYRVVINSDTYEVITVQDDHDWRILRRAELKRIDG